MATRATAQQEDDHQQDHDQGNDPKHLHQRGMPVSDGHRWGLAHHLRDVPDDELKAAAATMFGADPS